MLVSAWNRWLAEHKDHSVTELEVIHGALNNPATANRALLYFRDPAYVERLPPEQRGDFVEEDEQARKKLKALKNRIRDSGLAVHEGYANPLALGHKVLPADQPQASRRRLSVAMPNRTSDGEGPIATYFNPMD